MKERATIEDRLARARRRIDRLTPVEAEAATNRGAVIVDTRCGEDLRREGRIPGAIHVPLSLLEWRCDPDSETADGRLADLGLQIIVVCNDGYSSSLAASSLRDLGFQRAGDVIGGFRAWAGEGLPVESS
jgi:rhodanese-related sulfurtransferase